MAFRQNYGQQRAERDRLKQAKKNVKERKRRDAVLRRKTGPDADPPMGPEVAEPDSSQSTNGAEEAADS